MTTWMPMAPAPDRVPAGASAGGDGVVVGAGPVTVDAYIDFQCPYCKRFEEVAGPTLDRLVADQLINIDYHPMSFLDRLSTNHYSSRAASSSGCAADGGRFREYARALFAVQPPEGGPGLTDEELVERGRSVGLTDPGFARCVLGSAYLGWAAYVTFAAGRRGVGATPTVMVDGVPVPADPRAVAAAVAAVLEEA
ncbi:thioredoxin domain-containing protein [Actinoallomurus sp. NPDC052274]|uniref:DsbA family protein n=1 Tax=Actinoallomurus sp. NPDC052274 TaxID=3155420 RepID=UPI003416B804